MRMADGDHCRSIMFYGEPGIDNRRMVPHTYLFYVQYSLLSTWTSQRIFSCMILMTQTTLMTKALTLRTMTHLMTLIWRSTMTKTTRLVKKVRSSRTHEVGEESILGISQKRDLEQDGRKVQLGLQPRRWS